MHGWSSNVSLKKKWNVRVRLATAENWNWKHYSKIIFKCVNSTVEPIFNEKVVEKWSLWDPWIVHRCTIHRTHKPHFSATFSLKMGSTVLFIHSNIILLQYFQFSVISKWTLSVFKFHFSPNFAFVYFSSLIFKFIQLRIFHQLLLYAVVNFSIL